MGMVKNFKKERKNRSSVSIFLNQRYFLKYLYNNILCSLVTRQYAFERLKQRKLGISSQVHCRCNLTGRGRGIFPRYKVSRLVFRRLVSNGLVVGFRKSSW